MENQPTKSIKSITLRAVTVILCIVPVPHSGGNGGTDKPVYCLMAESMVEFFRTPAVAKDATGFPILPQKEH